MEELKNQEKIEEKLELSPSHEENQNLESNNYTKKLYNRQRSKYEDDCITPIRAKYLNPGKDKTASSINECNQNIFLYATCN